MKTVAAFCVSALICLGVAGRELDWRHAHPYQLGPSGYIVALAVAGLIASIAAGAFVWRQTEEQREADRQARVDAAAARPHE